MSRLRPRSCFVAIAICVAVTSTLALADPNHPEGDPSEPQGDEGSGSAMTEADMITEATALAEQETIVVEDEAPAESASSVHLDRDTLARRSRTQPSDILRNIPGLVVSQHAGGGK